MASSPPDTGSGTHFTHEIREMELYVEIFVDDHHGCITARTLALDFDDRELAIFCSLPWLDSTEMIAYCL
jgi:hypothetical protein